MNCPHCTGDHTLSQCPTWRAAATQPRLHLMLEGQPFTGSELELARIAGMSAPSMIDMTGNGDFMPRAPTTDAAQDECKPLRVSDFGPVDSTGSADMTGTLQTALNHATQPQAAMPDLAMTLRKAYNYGQTYWQQADSEYLSQQKKSNETADKFAAFVAETVAAFAAAPPSPQPVAESVQVDALRVICRLLDGSQPKDAAGALMVAHSALAGYRMWTYDMTPPQGFLDYVRANYNGVIDIHAPDWHAKRLWNAAMRTTPAAALQPVAGSRTAEKAGGLSASAAFKAWATKEFTEEYEDLGENMFNLTASGQYESMLTRNAWKSFEAGTMVATGLTATQLHRTGYGEGVRRAAQMMEDHDLPTMAELIRNLQSTSPPAMGAAALQPVAREGEAGGVTDEPTMLWDAEDAENCYGDGPEDFANNYASNCMMRGEEHEVEVLCAYRGSNRTMRIVMPQIGDEDGCVTWSWLNEPGATTAPAIEPVARLTDADIERIWQAHVVPVFGMSGINANVFARAIERHLTGNAGDQKGGAA